MVFQTPVNSLSLHAPMSTRDRHVALSLFSLPGGTRNGIDHKDIKPHGIKLSFIRVLALPSAPHAFSIVCLMVRLSVGSPFSTMALVVLPQLCYFDRGRRRV